jgi:hypothetical protein
MQPQYINIVTVVFQSHAINITQTLIVRLILQIGFEIDTVPPPIPFVCRWEIMNSVF